MRYSISSVKPTIRACQHDEGGRRKIVVKTRVGRRRAIENDYYIASATTSPACLGILVHLTLWLADYYITRAQTPAELKMALPIFEWTAITRWNRAFWRAGEPIYQ